MLNLYKTNKIELISELLAKKLLIDPPFITEQINISVNNYFLGKWIRDQITIANQISALYEFKTITEFTGDFIKLLLPKTNLTGWDYEALKWNILNSFEELKEFNESWPLLKWIEKYNDKKVIDKDIFILSNKIAKIFADYLIYRPEVIYR